MKYVLRCAGFLLVLTLAILIGRRIIVIRVSDWLSNDDPQRALAWDDRNPEALLALAQKRLEDGRLADAAVGARALLRIAPLQADAFGIIARTADASGDAVGARHLFALALRRAPRDLYARAWMIGTQLHDSDYMAALHNIDVLLDIAPEHERDVLPLLTRIAEQNSTFATVLGRHFDDQPRWRSAMLNELLAHATPTAVDRVFEAIMATKNGLGGAEANQWYARLEKDGRWDTAYSRWVGRTGVPLGDSMPPIYNGHFEYSTTNGGFDWVMLGKPGVQVQRIREGSGYVAQVNFLGRRADDIGFSQYLLLAPGRYKLTFRARAEDLRSDQGLRWDIRCMDGAALILTGPRLSGSFGWKPISADFDVPTDHCPAQQLALSNPGAAGAAKIVSGQMWFADFSVAPIPNNDP